VTEIAELQRDIADRLAHKPACRSVAKIIASCQGGECTRCGEACPKRAAQWLRDNSKSLQKLFLGSSGGVSVQEFRLNRTTWVQGKGRLADTSLDAIFKTLRRALDRLREPSLVAVGMIDAWWGSGEWSVGARVFVAVPPKIDLYRAFDHTKNIAGPLKVLPVPNVDAALKRLFRDAQRAKCTQWPADGAVPKRSLRGEYYAWLAGLKPTARIFRYGCDRYFNRFQKRPRKIVLKPKKRHPSPWWLAPYQYDTHAINCECNICRNRQNR
jgi:hypothetical protein